jgi:assimilatory nitrate reductase catalytic subunit
MAEKLNATQRQSLLAGRPGPGQADCGAIVCACFGVGAKTIEKAIHAQSLTSVDAIGDCLNAGTNCGSCIPELQQILSRTKPE